MIPIIAQYCMECKEWIEDSDTHKCSKDSWVLADKEMVGIADRLYSMGIVYNCYVGCYRVGYSKGPRVLSDARNQFA